MWQNTISLHCSCLLWESLKIQNTTSQSLLTSIRNYQSQSQIISDLKGWTMVPYQITATGDTKTINTCWLVGVWPFVYICLDVHLYHKLCVGLFLLELWTEYRKWICPLRIITLWLSYLHALLAMCPRWMCVNKWCHTYFVSCTGMCVSTVVSASRIENVCGFN